MKLNDRVSYKMKFQLALLYLGTWSMWISSTFAAEPGAKAIQSPPLPMGDANATRLTDIHDIKPALVIGSNLRWFYWALVIVGLSILAIIACRLWRKRKKTTAPELAVAPISAETEAYQMLDALAADGNAAPKQFYFRLSAILRRYIERRYEIPASEMTTEELLPTVDRLPLKTALAQPLKAFCRGADPIKFAGVGAEQNRMAQDLSFARDFVRQTTEMPNAGDGRGDQEHPPTALQENGVEKNTAEQSKRINDSTI